MSANSLQAMLDRAKANTDAAAPEPATAKKAASRKTRSATPVPDAATKAKGARASTRLIGGHFAPEVATQLRIIAAEESTTVQSLLAEALDDLFVKKGKARIAKR